MANAINPYNPLEYIANALMAQKQANQQKYEAQNAYQAEHPILSLLRNGRKASYDQRYQQAQAYNDNALFEAAVKTAPVWKDLQTAIAQQDMANMANTEAGRLGQGAPFREGAGLSMADLNKFMGMAQGPSVLGLMPQVLQNSTGQGFAMGGGGQARTLTMPGGVIPDPVDMQAAPVQPVQMAQSQQAGRAAGGKRINVEKALGKQKGLWTPLLNPQERAQGYHALGEQGMAVLKAVYKPQDYTIQLSAGGGVTKGHSNGKGGEHTNLDTFDIGLSNMTPKQQGLLLQRLKAAGANVLEEGRGTSNHHFHVRAGGAVASKPADGGSKSIQAMIIDAAKKYGVNPEIALGMAEKESNFRQNAVSPDGAIGVMQLMPGTAKELGVNPRDLAGNIDGGVRYLARMIKQGGGTEAGIAGYIGGQGGMAKYKQGQNVADANDNTFKYVDDVLRNSEKYKKLVANGVSPAAAKQMTQPAAQGQEPGQTKDGQWQDVYIPAVALNGQPVDFPAAFPNGMGTELTDGIMRAMATANGNGLTAGVQQAHNSAVDPSTVAENMAQAGAANALAAERNAGLPYAGDKASLEAEKLRMIVEFMRNNGGMTPGAYANNQIAQAQLGVAQSNSANTAARTTAGIQSDKQRLQQAQATHQVNALQKVVDDLKTQLRMFKNDNPKTRFQKGVLQRQITETQAQINNIVGVGGATKAGQPKQDAKPQASAGRSFKTSSGLSVTL